MKPRLRVLHPHGARMQFTEHLSNFLLNECRKPATFRVGTWLSSLDTGQFQALSLLTQRWSDGEESHELDDVVGVVVTALAAERDSGGRVELEPEELNRITVHFTVVVAMESFRRNAWVLLDTTLTMDPEGAIQMSVTEEGLAAHERMHLN